MALRARTEIYPGWESGTCFRTNRPCRRAPARQGMKSRSCGLVQRIGTADSATPHPDPCGGQAPALHFLIPPSTIGLQFGTFRRWRPGIEVDWRAHPGSESGTCFRTNDELGGDSTGATYLRTNDGIHLKRCSLRTMERPCNRLCAARSRGHVPSHGTIGPTSRIAKSGRFGLWIAASGCLAPKSQPHHLKECLNLGDWV